METTPAFCGLECRGCDEEFDAREATHRCPDCEGTLDPTYDYDAVSISRASLEARPFCGMWRYEELLPFPREASVTMAEGTTPLIECPDLASEVGVSRLLIKDEGRNPTGSFEDRGQALAVSAATQHGASAVVLAAAGNAGQAAVAYAARADIDAHVFVPSRANFINKAMINVHGGDMTVVEGRLHDAIDACRERTTDREGWYSIAAFRTPYRHEGTKTLFYEIAEQLDWAAPDAIVCPTGGGVALVSLYNGAAELKQLGLTDRLPRLYAAQSSGCRPIVDAWDRKKDRHDPWETPDTICGEIEVPDPIASPLVLEALRESDGEAIATPDKEILDSAVTVAQHEGLELGVACGAAASGTWTLTNEGEFDDDETVVLLNTASGNVDADVLRSHLMGMGV